MIKINEFNSDDNHLIDVLEKLLNFLVKNEYQFTTVTPVTHQLWLDRNLQGDAKDLRGIFGWSMPFAQSLLEEELFSLLKSVDLIIPQADLWKSCIRVSSIGKTLFIHSAFPTQQNDAVFFGPDTYRFLIGLENYLNSRDHPLHNAVEMCCGTAPAAITIAQKFVNVDVCAVDINPKALLYSKANSRGAHVEIKTINNDLFKNFTQNFDLIVANPPYMMDRQKRAYRDGGELLGCELALKIVEESLDLLALNGCLLLYTGVCIIGGHDIFCEHVQILMDSTDDQYTWTYQEIDVDVFSDELLFAGYEDVERIAAVILKIHRIV